MSDAEVAEHVADLVSGKLPGGRPSKAFSDTLQGVVARIIEASGVDAREAPEATRGATDYVRRLGERLRDPIYIAALVVVARNTESYRPSEATVERVHAFLRGPINLRALARLVPKGSG
jgi:hypothetical protein